MKTTHKLLIALLLIPYSLSLKAQCLDTTIINNIWNSYSHRWTAQIEQNVLLIMADSIALAQHTASAGGNVYYPGVGLTLTTYTFGLSASYLAAQIHDSTQHYMLLHDSSYMASKVWAESYVAQHGGGGGGTDTSVAGSASIQVTHPTSGAKVVSIIAPVTIANGGTGGTYISPDSIKVTSSSLIINGQNKAVENDTASGSATALTVSYINIVNGEQFNILYAKTTASNLVLTFPNNTTLSQASHYVTSGLTETITSSSSGLFMIKGQRFGNRYVITIIEIIP